MVIFIFSILHGDDAAKTTSFWTNLIFNSNFIYIKFENKLKLKIKKGLTKLKRPAWVGDGRGSRVATGSRLSTKSGQGLATLM